MGSGSPSGKRNGRHGERTRDSGAAEIERIAENAPRWPELNA
jgi:hypothetical protein